jgi:hypothetical protein
VLPIARSRELEFVTRLARLQPSAADIARARDLAVAPTQWARVEALAQHHGLTGLLHRSIRSTSVAVPSEVAARLEASALSDAAGNLAKFARWTALCQRFADAGVRAMTYKGFHVALSIYDDVGIRPVGDLDFLVEAADVGRAIEVAAQKGYWLTRRWRAALDNVGLPYALSRAHEMQLGAFDRLAVDLHWHVAPAGLAVPTAELLANATVQDALGTSVLVPNRVHSAVILIAHGHKSHWHRFRWVVDVAEAFARLTPEERLQVRERLQRMDLLHALEVIEALMAMSWQGEAERTPATSRALQHIVNVHERVFDTYQLHDVRRPLRLARERIAEHGSLLKAMRTAVRPSHQDWAAIRIPPPFRAGYYAVRPFRVLRDAVSLVRREKKPAGASLRPSPAAEPALTFVTAIYDSGPDSLLGGRGRGLAHFLPTLRNVASLGAPLVVFCSRADAPRVRDALTPMFQQLEVVPFELSQFEFYRAFVEWKSEYRERLQLNDRNEVLCFLKAYWLADVSRRRPFGHPLTYWIDAGLFHHGIFPERVGGVEMLVRASEDRFYPTNRQNLFSPALQTGLAAATPMGKLFFCALPMVQGGFPLPAYNAIAAERGGSAIADHLIGGIFGGRDLEIQRLLVEFRRLLAHAIGERIYTLEEQLFSILHAVHPDWFALQRFGTWHFYSPGEPCSYLDAEGDSFYKIFTRLAGASVT